MKTDYSKQIYDTYYSLTDRVIELILKDGRCIRGIICGFFKGDPESGESYITKWHIVGSEKKDRFRSNFLGCITGEIIKQEDIQEIHFNDGKKI